MPSGFLIDAAYVLGFAGGAFVLASLLWAVGAGVAKLARRQSGQRNQNEQRGTARQRRLRS